MDEINPDDFETISDKLNQLTELYDYPALDRSGPKDIQNAYKEYLRPK